jgi:hypothetical protein
MAIVGEHLITVRAYPYQRRRTGSPNPKERVPPCSDITIRSFENSKKLCEESRALPEASRIIVAEAKEQVLARLAYQQFP